MEFNKKNALQILSLIPIIGMAWYFASHAGEYGPWIVRSVMVVLFVAMLGIEAWIEKNIP